MLYFYRYDLSDGPSCSGMTRYDLSYEITPVFLYKSDCITLPTFWLGYDALEDTDDA